MIDNVLLMGIGAYSTVFLSIAFFSSVLAYIFRELSLKKIYLNNIDMVLLRTRAIGTGASSNFNLNCNLARFGVHMVKLSHEKMLILRCIPPPPQKKNTTKPPPEKD